MQKKKLNKSEKVVIKTGIVFNILLFIVAAILLITGDFFGKSQWIILYYTLMIPVFIYWIYLLVWWYKYDKRINHFLGLFFLMGFFSLYYGIKILKEKGSY